MPAGGLLAACWRPSGLTRCPGSLRPQELVLSSPLATKFSACVAEHEIDGEVLGTFALEEVCEATGLPFVRDLASHAIDTRPAAPQTLASACATWGQALADAMAARRLFSRVQAPGAAVRSCADVQERLQSLIMTRVERCSRSTSPPLSAAQAGQIEALVAARLVAQAARLDSGDFALLAPSEALALLPPWMRGRENTTLQLVSLLLNVQQMSTSSNAPDLPLALDKTVIVVLGNTGAGKSTLLNAFLNEVELLPTNAMRACTASIIEMEYNADQVQGREYTADVDFKSKEEWAQEVREAFALVHQANGSSMGGTVQTPEENTAAHEAFCKLRAAYGDEMDWTSAEALLGAPPSSSAAGGAQDSFAARRRIHASLSTTYAVSASSGSALCEQYSSVVDSVNDASQGSLWPIVKRVLLRGPWPVLSSGVRLVDAPGLADDNSARDAVVKKVLQEANCVWLVSNIRRAVNDKTVSALKENERRPQ